jgi:hypothetical protein
MLLVVFFSSQCSKGSNKNKKVDKKNGKEKHDRTREKA